jgi:hypothetical protein
MNRLATLELPKEIDENLFYGRSIVSQYDNYEKENKLARRAFIKNSKLKKIIRLGDTNVSADNNRVSQTD